MVDSLHNNQMLRFAQHENCLICLLVTLLPERGVWKLPFFPFLSAWWLYLPPENGIAFEDYLWISS